MKWEYLTRYEFNYLLLTYCSRSSQKVNIVWYLVHFDKEMALTVFCVPFFFKFFPFVNFCKCLKLYLYLFRCIRVDPFRIYPFNWNSRLWRIDCYCFKSLSKPTHRIFHFRPAMKDSVGRLGKGFKTVTIYSSEPTHRIFHFRPAMKISNYVI